MKDVVIHIERNNEEQKQRAIKQLKDMGYDGRVRNHCAEEYSNFDCVYAYSDGHLSIDFHLGVSNIGNSIPLQP